MLQNESENESDDIDQTEADDNEQAKSSELNYKHNKSKDLRHLVMMEIVTMKF